MWNKLEEIPILKKGGIHIKKKNRGKFTESANRAGMGVQEFANHVLANKDKYSPTLVKRANFARNSKKFKHECGGILKAQQGTGNLFSIKPGSPLDQAWQAANEKLKYPGVKQIVGPDGNKVAIRTEEPLKSVYISEYLPGTGDLAEAGYIANDVKNGNYGTAALAAGLMMLPGNIRKILDGYGVKITTIKDKPSFTDRIPQPEYDLFRRQAKSTSPKLSYNESKGYSKHDRTNKQKESDELIYDKMSDKQWDDLYFRFLNKGRIDRAEKLVDKHFVSKTKDNKLFDPGSSDPLLYYHVSDGIPFSKYDKSLLGKNWKESKRFAGRPGMFVTPGYPDRYWGEKTKMVFHLYDPTPTFNSRQYDFNLPFDNSLAKWRAEDAIKKMTTLSKHTSDGSRPYDETTVFNTELLKFASPVTFDDTGNIIPLSKRHDFKVDDFRYKNGGKL